MLAAIGGSSASEAAMNLMMIKDAITGKIRELTTSDLGGSAAASLTRGVLLAAATATGAGSAVADSGRPPSFDATVTGTGAVSATVVIQGRNAASGGWVTMATITLSGTATATDGFAILTRYVEYRANLTAVSGTGAAVTVTMGS